MRASNRAPISEKSSSRCDCARRGDHTRGSKFAAAVPQRPRLRPPAAAISARHSCADPGVSVLREGVGQRLHRQTRGGVSWLFAKCVFARHGGSPLEGSARRHGCSRRGGVAGISRSRRRSGQRARRHRRNRSHRRRRAAAERQRPHPGLHRARQRRHRAPHRGARPRSRRQLGGVRARQFERRADRPADRRAALSDGRLADPVARPRHVAHRQHHAELRRPSGPRRQRDRRHLPHHPRSRRRHHLRRRAAHAEAAADLSVGARRLQGQGQQLHALPRHRHRHRRPAGAVPDHPVRGQGQRDVSGGRGARMGGARLHRRRLRILGQGVRHVGRRRTDMARLRRSDPRGDAAGVPVRLSQSEPLARPLCPHRHRLARLPRCACRRRAGRSGDRLGHRAAVAVVRRHRRIWPRDLSRRRRASTARCC